MCGDSPHLHTSPAQERGATCGKPQKIQYPLSRVKCVPRSTLAILHPPKSTPPLRGAKWDRQIQLPQSSPKEIFNFFPKASSKKTPTPPQSSDIFHPDGLSY